LKSKSMGVKLQNLCLLDGLVDEVCSLSNCALSR
jgi:hypothetical protein